MNLLRCDSARWNRSELDAFTLPNEKTMNTDADRREDGANRDLISGALGAHPVGSGVGAMVGGAAAGALTGTVAGPIGTVIGAAVGAVVGGLAGKDVAEAIDPTREGAYWRENYGGRRYVEQRSIFDDDGPVYEFGVSAFGRYPSRYVEAVEPAMSSEWNTRRGASRLSWDRARHAARDAWRHRSGLE